MSSNTAQFNGESQVTEGWQLYRLPELIQVWDGLGPAVPPRILVPGTAYRLVHLTNLGSSEIEFSTPDIGEGHHHYDSLGG